MENRNEVYTFDEIIERTANMLGSIMVPVGLTEQISKPIGYAIENLQNVVKAMREQAAKEADPPVVGEQEPQEAQEPNEIEG